MVGGVDNKAQLLAWAYVIIKEQVDKGLHGNIRLDLAAGNIGGVKVEESFRPPGK